MTFIPVTTINVSLPVTSCSGNRWLWMLDRTLHEEKTIQGQKSLCVRQESMDSPRGCAQRARASTREKTRIVGAGVGRKDWTSGWAPVIMRQSAPSQTDVQKAQQLPVAPELAEFTCEIKSYFHLLLISWDIMFFYLPDTRQSEYCFHPKKLCSFTSNWNLVNVVFRFIIGDFVLFKLLPYLSLKEMKYFEIH